MVECVTFVSSVRLLSGVCVFGCVTTVCVCLCVCACMWCMWCMCALFLSLVTHRVSHNTHTHERVCCVSVRACAVRVCGADVYRSGFKRGYGGKRVLRSQVPVGRRDAQYTRDTYVRVIVSCCASSGCERCCYHGCTRRWCEKGDNCCCCVR